MTENECLAKMIAPGTRRPGKYREGVIQIWVTRNCDKACYCCTQGSNLKGNSGRMTPEQFQNACLSLRGYYGVVGMFGGNPATHPDFEELCNIMRQLVPWEQRGLWCNNPFTPERARLMRATFNPAVSNLNVHLDQDAYRIFKQEWPECNPVGLHTDSRHSPPFVAMKDLKHLPRPKSEAYPHGKPLLAYVPNTEENRHDLIAECDINQHWSAMVGVFRGELRAWFCEIAGAQSILHQWDTQHDKSNKSCLWIDTTNLPSLEKVPPCMCYTYPDTGIPIPYERALETSENWWSLPMTYFADQVRKHCHECGVPLRGYGELSQAEDGTDYVSKTHEGIFTPKKTCKVEHVQELYQIGTGKLSKVTHYLQNSGIK